MQEFQVKGRSFTSPYSNMEALAVLRGDTGNFAKSLLKQWDTRRQLSPRQWPWVHRLAVDATKKDVEVSSTFEAIVNLFRTAAANGMKRPKISFPQAKFSLAGPNSKNHGSIQVSKGTFHTGKYFGRIAPDGTFTPGRDFDPEVLSFMEAFSSDPVGYATSSGVESGSCRFCSKELTTTESVSVGYGPVCASHWGLPWGK